MIRKVRRRVKAMLSSLAIFGALCVPPAAGQSVAGAREAFRSGEFEDAIDEYRDVVKSDPAAAQARIGLIETLVAIGEYAEAVEIGQSAPSFAAVANATGSALVHLGRRNEAEAAFTVAIEARNTLSLTAQANLAELKFDRGDIDEAMSLFDRFIDVYNGADGRLSGRDLVAVGRAVKFLGRTDPDLFHDALRAFDEASSLDPGWAEPRVRTGNLFLGKYNSPSAQSEFERVLGQNPRHPGALLGLAKALIFDGTSDARLVLDRLLDINPNHVEARALLATEYLTNEGHEEARSEAEKALEVNPQSLLALTALAGSHMLADEPVAFSRVRGRALAINPRYARLDVALAKLAVKTRRYHEAVKRAEAAVALDSASWEAWGLLGMNELRVGDIEEGRTHLERAFAGDPFNPWFFNNLDLLDTFDRFEVRRTDHFSLFLHGTESELLAKYLEPLAEEAFASLSRRYGVEPTVPVRAEFYPSHADFSVRTLGEVGLGALGVSFGRVLVMDSPTARELGDYNWASVFWHELAHTFHLAMTDNRVPRWFSEGLAVHEQRRAREGWGHQPSLAFIRAIRDDDLKKVSELNDGFMRPQFPQQVIFSYYQASLVFEVIEEEYGFAAIRDMLDGYRRGETTEALFESVLDTSLEDFDEEFDDYLHSRFRGPLGGLVEIGVAPELDADTGTLRDHVRAHPGDLVSRLRLGIALFGDEAYDEAEIHLEAALRIFPEYGAADSPYWFLALIHRERGDLERAAGALARLTALSESNYTALLTLAEILEELGRPDESAEALDKAVQIWPYEMDLHKRLADLHTGVGNFAGAVRERGAVVALDPVDRAEALYELAVAQHADGDRRGARRSVMGALGIAPNYEDALEFLLALQGGSEKDLP